MKDERICRAYQQIELSRAEKDTMLAEILSAGQNTKIRRFPMKKALTIAAAAAAVVCAVALPRLTAVPSAPPAPLPVTVGAPAASSPNGMRRFLNYNGLRYAFLENGAAYTLAEGALGENLGTLTLDIMADPRASGSADFAATFALGGELFTLTGYDPAFRIAVQLDGLTYLAESVDRLDGSDVDAAAYFKTAGFDRLTERVEICDHMGFEVLNTLEGEAMQSLLDGVAQSVPAQLTDEDYQSIGHAQTEGKSFLLKLHLADGTAYSLYVIPELGISMIGDNRYTLPAGFDASAFDGLTQQPLPM